MKLRNKKTGEVRELPDGFFCGDTMKRICEEWEDYDEPKEYYYIYANRVLKGECDGIIDNRFKEIGNYFETEEEAEQAVEKLKAWKRLKDKGFRFNGWKCTGSISFTFDNYCGDGQPMSASDYLDLLFGGEE